MALRLGGGAARDLFFFLEVKAALRAGLGPGLRRGAIGGGVSMTVAGLDNGALLRLAAGACGGDSALWERFVGGMEPCARRGLWSDFFGWQAHGGQRLPERDDWAIWLIMAGRGFGKTRAGAEWVLRQARANPGARIALLGGTADEVARVMIEGPSGLLTLSGDAEEMVWVPTRGHLRFANGAEAFAYSAAAPEGLRGPEHHFAWADELAKWESSRAGQDSADRALDNLMMGLRLGDVAKGMRPQVVVTTTPRPVAALKRLRAMPGLVETNGRTAQNAHLAGAFKAWAEETYKGTRLGRQELDGVLFDEPEGSLFPRELLEQARVSGVAARDAVGPGRGAERLPYLKRHPGMDSGWPGEAFWRRVVVGVDPPASAKGDACGIVVCGLGADGVAYVLADRTVRGKSPEGWARAVAAAASEWDASRVVAEANQGGEMVASVLHAVDDALPIRLVSASRGKCARAEPVAARMERGRVKLAGAFPALEDELNGLTAGGAYVGPGGSPDRADACVWALSELIGSGEPRVRCV